MIRKLQINQQVQASVYGGKINVEIAYRGRFKEIFSLSPYLSSNVAQLKKLLKNFELIVWHLLCNLKKLNSFLILTWTRNSLDINLFFPSTRQRVFYRIRCVNCKVSRTEYLWSQTKRTAVWSFKQILYISINTRSEVCTGNVQNLFYPDKKQSKFSV